MFIVSAPSLRPNAGRQTESWDYDMSIFSLEPASGPRRYAQHRPGPSVRLLRKRSLLLSSRGNGNQFPAVTVRESATQAGAGPYCGSHVVHEPQSRPALSVTLRQSHQARRSTGAGCGLSRRHSCAGAPFPDLGPSLADVSVA